MGNLTGKTEKSGTVGAFDKAGNDDTICILLGDVDPTAEKLCRSDVRKSCIVRTMWNFLSHLHTAWMFIGLVYYTNQYGKSFYIALRKVIVRMWYLPYNYTHCIILPFISNTDSVELALDKRCIKFVWSCLKIWWFCTRLMFNKIHFWWAEKNAG